MKSLRKLFAIMLLACISIFYSLANADLEIHFLDVEQGDAAIIMCDEQAMMIDGGGPKSSQFIYSYLVNTLGLDHLSLVVATHPHDDHIGGLAAALNAVSTDRIISPVKSYDSKRFKALLKYAEVELEIPLRGAVYHLGDALITILSSTIGLESNDINDLSIVLRIDYVNTSFLFTGDATIKVEEDLISVPALLNCDVLKVAHHGSDTSSSMDFLSAVSPTYAVISVGQDNSYGHPSQSTLDNLFSVGAQIYSTAINGTIICRSDGLNLTFELEKNSGVVEDTFSNWVENPIQVGNSLSSYVGNSNSKKFHYPNCDSVTKMKDKNKVYFNTREDAISQGFEPCKQCKP